MLLDQASVGLQIGGSDCATIGAHQCVLTRTSLGLSAARSARVLIQGYRVYHTLWVGSLGQSLTIPLIKRLRQTSECDAKSRFFRFQFARPNDHHHISFTDAKSLRDLYWRHQIG